MESFLVNFRVYNEGPSKNLDIKTALVVSFSLEVVFIIRH